MLFSAIAAEFLLHMGHLSQFMQKPKLTMIYSNPVVAVFVLKPLWLETFARKTFARWNNRETQRTNFLCEINLSQMDKYTWKMFGKRSNFDYSKNFRRSIERIKITKLDSRIRHKITESRRKFSRMFFAWKYFKLESSEWLSLPQSVLKLSLDTEGGMYCHKSIT